MMSLERGSASLNMWHMRLSNSLVSVNFRLKSSPVEYLGDRPPLSRHLTKKGCGMSVVVGGGFWGGEGKRKGELRQKKLQNQIRRSIPHQVFWKIRSLVWRWGCMLAFHVIGAQNQQSKPTFPQVQSDTVDGRNPAPPGMQKNPVSNGINYHINWCKISSINSIMYNRLQFHKRILPQITDWNSTVVPGELANLSTISTYSLQLPVS